MGDAGWAALGLALVIAAADPSGAQSGSGGLKSPSSTFATSWELELREGVIWRRALVEPSGGTPSWSLLPPAGLPAPKGRVEAWKELVPVARAFAHPSRIVELSADGENVVAVDPTGRVYYAKLGTLDWDDVWGPPGVAAPLELPRGKKAWSISHRKQAYTDIDGNAHPVSAGVTTLYVLTDDDRIVYADPWLPPRFDHEVCGPERGRLVLTHLSASASTIAVMDDGGRVFTRLADFDTMGHNPALPYTWERGRRTGVLENVRTLPPEDWREQPGIPGPHATTVTLFQTGTGNAARTLRVEGEGGVWEKTLTATSWTFIPSAVPQTGGPTTAFPQPRLPTVNAPRGVRLEGRLKDTKIVVEDFQLACPGSKVTLTRGAESVEMTLWFTDRLLEVSRRERDLEGALLLVGEPQGKLAEEVREVFGGKRSFEVEVDVKGQRVEITPMDRDKRHWRVALRKTR